MPLVDWADLLGRVPFLAIFLVALYMFLKHLRARDEDSTIERREYVDQQKQQGKENTQTMGAMQERCHTVHDNLMKRVEEQVKDTTTRGVENQEKFAVTVTGLQHSIDEHTKVTGRVELVLNKLETNRKG